MWKGSTAAGVSRVAAPAIGRALRVGSSVLPRLHRMLRAGKSHEHGLLDRGVASLSISPARIDRVSVVEATADRVSLNYLIAHDGGGGLSIGRARGNRISR